MQIRIGTKAASTSTKAMEKDAWNTEMEIVTMETGNWGVMMEKASLVGVMAKYTKVTTWKANDRAKVNICSRIRAGFKAAGKMDYNMGMVCFTKVSTTSRESGKMENCSADCVYSSLRSFN